MKIGFMHKEGRMKYVYEMAEREHDVELFDYEVIGQDREQLHNIIKSYMMGKYNLTLEEVENHEIFTNKNL